MQFRFYFCDERYKSVRNDCDSCLYTCQCHNIDMIKYVPHVYSKKELFTMVDLTLIQILLISKTESNRLWFLVGYNITVIKKFKQRLYFIKYIIFLKYHRERYYQ